MDKFNQDGFPIIRFYDRHFEVKAIDYWEFRSFQYNEVIDIDYYHPSSNWVGSSIYFLSQFDPYQLKIKKMNGADWSYNAPSKFNSEFAEILNELRNKCGLEKKSWN